MAEHRPFPPSPRRRAAARRAGLHAASAIAVGAVATAGALIAVSALGRAIAARAGAWIAAACTAPADIAPRAGALAPSGVAGAVLELALPILAAAAFAAAVAHLAQARAVWLPRRRIAGAPALDRGPGPRTARAAGELAAAAAIGAVAVGWLWLAAPRLAAVSSVPLAGAALLASAVAALATAWAVIGALDALLRHRELALALRMTPREQRDDERLAGADPRWRRRRAEDRRIAGSRSSASRDAGGARHAVASATVVVLGDGLAVAIAWDPVHRPVPLRTATGRAAHATQLVALARHLGIPIHRDPALASAVAGDPGPVAEPHWPRLAELVAAVRRA